MPRNREIRAYRAAMRDMAKEFGADYLCEMEYYDQTETLSLA